MLLGIAGQVGLQGVGASLRRAFMNISRFSKRSANMGTREIDPALPRNKMTERQALRVYSNPKASRNSNKMSSRKDFVGARSPRFPPIPFQYRQEIGPDTYQKDKTAPTLILPVNPHAPPFGTKVVRVCEQQEQGVAPTAYTLPTGLDLLAKRITSKREILNSNSTRVTQFAVSYSDYADINYAIGRHVANDYRFSLLKSQALKQRQVNNREQNDEIARYLEKRMDCLQTRELAEE